MTKEQAKEILRCNTDLGHGVIIENESTQSIYEALNMAINALEQDMVLRETYEVEYFARREAERKLHDLQQNTCDDCISRVEILKEMAERRKNGDRITIGYIKNMPSVIPTRKVGKWIRKPTRNDKGGCIGAEMICSCCNKDNRHDEYMDFCPNCGAEMRGNENE